jgi:hypothetical protein
MSDRSVLNDAARAGAVLQRQQAKQRDLQTIKLLASRHGELVEATASLEAAVTCLEDAKRAGAAINTDVEISLLRPDVPNDAAAFLQSNELTNLRSSVNASARAIRMVTSEGYRTLTLNSGAHPLDPALDEVLTRLALDKAAARAIDLLRAASKRWRRILTDVEDAILALRKGPLESPPTDAEAVKSATFALSEAWAAVARTGLSQERVDILQGASGGSVSLSSVSDEDITWLRSVGLGHHLELSFGD